MKKIRSIMVGIALMICHNAWAQPDVISMTFPVKDFNGDVAPLHERLNPERNYLILFSAFWCQPCVNALNNTHSQKIEEYREDYNLEVIIFDDQHYDRIDVANSKIKAFQWRFQMYMLDDLYSELGITSIPRYYFLPAGETEALIASRSRYLEEIDDYYADRRPTTTLYQANRQVIVQDDCDDPIAYEFSSKDSIRISNKPYIEIDGHAYNTDIIGRNLYRYDPLTFRNVPVFDYHLRHCDEFELRDHEGDALTLYAEEVVDEDGHITIITDAVISIECGEDIPFVMSTRYGSNAGIHFDIEDGEIKTRLICHDQNDNQIYSDPDLEVLCSAVSTNEQNLNEVTLTNNPGNGQFEILGLDAMEKSVEIYDINGIKIRELYSRSSVDITRLPVGTYLICVSIPGREIHPIKYIKR